MIIADNEDPVINNVDDIEENTLPGLSYAFVNWTKPDITDNSGDWSVEYSRDNTVVKFSIGDTKITITAQDPSGNTASEVFFVTVLGKPLRRMIPPMVVHPEKIDFRRFV